MTSFFARVVTGGTRARPICRLPYATRNSPKKTALECVEKKAYLYRTLQEMDLRTHNSAMPDEPHLGQFLFFWSRQQNLTMFHRENAESLPVCHQDKNINRDIKRKRHYYGLEKQVRRLSLSGKDGRASHRQVTGCVLYDGIQQSADRFIISLTSKRSTRIPPGGPLCNINAATTMYFPNASGQKKLFTN